MCVSSVGCRFHRHVPLPNAHGLLIRGVLSGIEFYLYPDLSRLKEPQAYKGSCKNWLHNSWPYGMQFTGPTEQDFLALWNGTYWPYGTGLTGPMEWDILALRNGTFWPYGMGRTGPKERDVLVLWQKNPLY
ncbi:hypothetical protein XENTR_v10020226 [Xenopus tropicalis]|nr:hypothetical protein XENTR_v10020226 [Xenopus tropicalis]